MHILVEHKKKYLSRRIDEIEELKKCLINNDFEVAISIGHRLKGNGETFGYPAVSVIGSALEQAALVKDKLKLHQMIDLLAENINDNLNKINDQK